MKSGIFIILALIIWAESILTQILHENQSIDGQNDLELEWDIISEFMKDQHVVTLFVQKYNEDMANKIFKYSTKNVKFGVYYYNNITLISQFWLSSRKYVMYTSRIYGAIVVMNDLSTMAMVINASANNRLVLIWFNVNLDDIKKFMLDVWNRQKFFEILVLSLHDYQPTVLIQLNPFEPKFFEYSLKLQHTSRTVVKLINHRYRLFMKNMAGYKIKVLLFNSSGNLIDFSSVEKSLLILCQKFMNFTPIIVSGLMLKSKSGSGLIKNKDIENGDAEIGLNNRFIEDVVSNNTVFLYPMNTVPMCFVVPINYEEVPLEVLTYECFDFKSRLVITINLAILSVIWVLGRYLVKQNVETATDAIPFKVIAILHSVTVTSPKVLFNRIIFITIALFSLLLTSVYQGTVVEQLNNPLKPHQLNTINELFNSNLNITLLSYIKLSVDKNKQNKEDNIITIDEIDRKAVLQFDRAQDGLDMVAYNKTTALLIPLTYYPIYSSKYFNKTTGLNLLHLIKESPTSIYVSLVIARNSPYIDIFNNIIKLARESGILTHEVTVVTDQQRLDYIRRIKRGYIPKQANQFRPIQLADVVYLRIFLIINWILSAVVFLLEHAVHLLKTYCQKNNWLSYRTDL